MQITFETESSGFIVIKNAQRMIDLALKTIYGCLCTIEKIQDRCNNDEPDMCGDENVD